jgi:hypothetical protein
MSNLHSRLIAAVALATLVGCASRGRDWPSLMTPEEQRTGLPATATVPPETPEARSAGRAPLPAVTPDPTASTPTVPGPTPDATSSTASIRAQTSRLAEARRDSSYILERFKKQKDILANAVAGIKTNGPGDSQWNKSQLELTKLNQIAAEWDDLEAIVDHVAGQLAISAHQGAVVTAPLADAGVLLVQIDQARAEAVRIRDVMRRRISR